jgi:dihydrolipoamide dehydrogenase
MSIQTDIAVLGSGPGGYVAALRAAQLGAKVVVIEENVVGGVCLNVGCIPTKALLRSAEVYRTFQQAKSFGLRLEGSVSADWPAIQIRKEKAVQRLVRGVEKLLDKAGVQVLQGRGRFIAPRVLEVTATSGVERVEAKNVVIATGSRPVQLPLPGMDLPGVNDSTGALALENLPQRLLIVGGGVIGAEFADIFGAFGVQVTIVEMLNRLLPLMDADLGESLARTMKRRRIKLHLDSRVTRVETVDGGLSATVATPKGEISLEADQILVAVGRRPNVEDLGLDVAGVRVEKTGIPVDARMQTNVPGVYAIGDVTGQMLLAHVASQGGEVAVENALGHPARLDLKTAPNVVYTDPEVASVGLTEAQAREAGYDVQVGRFPLTANGKAVTYGETDGFVKVVSERRFGEVLGLHIVAPHASDLIHEGGVALALETTLDEIAATVHAHPTLGEAVREAVLAARGGALHLPQG